MTPGLGPLPAEPTALRESVRAVVLESPERWSALAADGHWIADELWGAWATELGSAGIDADAVADAAASYGQELWWWILGERTWSQCIDGLAGRVWRRRPDAEERLTGSPAPDPG